MKRLINVCSYHHRQAILVLYISIIIMSVYTLHNCSTAYHAILQKNDFCGSVVKFIDISLRYRRRQQSISEQNHKKPGR